MIEAYPNLSSLLHFSEQLSGQSLTEKPNQNYLMCSHIYSTNKILIAFNNFNNLRYYAVCNFIILLLSFLPNNIIS